MKFLNPNWRAINKAIEAGEITELRSEERELTKKIQAKVDAYYKAKRENEAINKIKALQNLPVGSNVYYTGRSTDINFGAQGTKVKDGRTRMIVDIDGKKWSCYYTNLKIEETTAQENTSHKITTKLTEFFK